MNMNFMSHVEFTRKNKIFYQQMDRDLNTKIFELIGGEDAVRYLYLRLHISRTDGDSNTNNK